MAPKGKKGKKAGDDWDEGLGESADPIAQAEAEAKAADAEEEEETGGGGGLMAALKKNKEKRKKKGKNVDLDELEGEGDTVTPTVDESLDLAAKAPEEATMDDEDAFCCLPAGKKSFLSALKFEPHLKERNRRRQTHLWSMFAGQLHGLLNAHGLLTREEQHVARDQGWIDFD